MSPSPSSSNSPLSPDGFTPTQQLLATLRSSITACFSNHRPLLTHLNADTTWLFSLPHPNPSANPLERAYYHILIDPWLRGGQADVAKFFSQQWHKEASAVQSIEEVEGVIKGIEDVARAHEDAEDTLSGERDAGIDAVVVSHEFTDHMHKETLLEIDVSVPIFSTAKAASIIRSWGHFAHVYDIQRFNSDWRDSSTSPLPSWLGISRVAYPGADLLYYHSAIMMTFTSGDSKEAEAVIYTPHGISPENMEPVSRADPPIKTLALLHGLQDISIRAQFSLGAQLNKGAHNGLRVQRLLGAKYWVGTHDEVKKGGGVVSWFLQRKIITLKEAMEREGEEYDGVGLEDVRFEELGNGVSLILD